MAGQDNQPTDAAELRRRAECSDRYNFGKIWSGVPFNARARCSCSLLGNLASAQSTAGDVNHENHETHERNDCLEMARESFVQHNYVFPNESSVFML
jgi:hypothetical protein